MSPAKITLSPKKLRTLSLLGITIITILLLAAGLSKLQLLPGRPFPLAGILQSLSNSGLRFSGRLSIPIEVIYVLTGCLWVLLIVSVIAFIISPQVRKDVFKRVITYTIWFILFFSLIRLLQSRLPIFQQQDQGPANGLPADFMDPSELIPTPPDFILDPPQWFVIGITVLLIAIPLSLAWLLWRFFPRQRVDETTPLESLTQEAQQALDELQAGKDLKDTVMRCYAEMSYTLSKQRNLQRAAGMTPTEFERYLTDCGLQSEHIKRLTRLFERVRYGGKTVGRREENEAIACLTAIVKTYGTTS